MFYFLENEEFIIFSLAHVTAFALKFKDNCHHFDITIFHIQILQGEAGIRYYYGEA